MQNKGSLNLAEGKFLKSIKKGTSVLRELKKSRTKKVIKNEL